MMQKSNGLKESQVHEQGIVKRHDYQQRTIHTSQLELTFAANATAKDKLREGEADNPALQQTYAKFTFCRTPGNCATLQ